MFKIKRKGGKYKLYLRCDECGKESMLDISYQGRLAIRMYRRTKVLNMSFISGMDTEQRSIFLTGSCIDCLGKWFHPFYEMRKHG